MSVRALVLLTLLAGCTFERRTLDYACPNTSDCDDGRVCNADGWCVVSTTEPDAGGDAGPTIDSGPMIDGGPPADASTPDAFVCPPGCTSCVGDLCVITCAPTGSCATQVVCPAGVKCKVECNGDSSCGAGVDCSAAASCVIECTNTGSCAGALTCGAGRCRVECQGGDSCLGGIDCSDSCACDTFCTGVGSCTTLPVCAHPEGPQGCVKSGECESTAGQCNDC